MTLSENEITDILKSLIRCNIDLNQGVNYYLNSKYKEGTENLLLVTKSLQEIISKIND